MPEGPVDRVLPFWNSTLAPELLGGQRLLISAHGNSIRALVKYLDGVSYADIVGLNIPNGIPLVYELDAGLQRVRHYHLRMHRWRRMQRRRGGRAGARGGFRFRQPDPQRGVRIGFRSLADVHRLNEADAGVSWQG